MVEGNTSSILPVVSALVGNIFISLPLVLVIFVKKHMETLAKYTFVEPYYYTVTGSIDAIGVIKQLPLHLQHANTSVRVILSHIFVFRYCFFCRGGGVKAVSCLHHHAVKS